MSSPREETLLQVLERLLGLLESQTGSLVLLERGDSEVVARHPGFRLFAAMNPATDAGKRHLPAQVRTHFTELFVDEPESENDLVRAAFCPCRLCSCRLYPCRVLCLLRQQLVSVSPSVLVPNWGTCRLCSCRLCPPSAPAACALAVCAPAACVFAVASACCVQLYLFFHPRLLQTVQSVFKLSSLFSNCPKHPLFCFMHLNEVRITELFVDEPKAENDLMHAALSLDRLCSCRSYTCRILCLLRQTVPVVV